eukprot:CAMPEP_0119327672 /NCGR_PEP_ID=MMETSP1333-20130426/71417_1 /TAXON_ID=418940 /ORGANISM="Scyphosphaera apsteinii, Strain RCC1455" /LENGTH=170 /DNA_ID=CAMNT_0007336333 /DNA_START=29 /DNA_END=538 /DNA_ORIENTATION=+
MSGFAGAQAASVVLDCEQWRERIRHEGKEACSGIAKLAQPTMHCNENVGSMNPFVPMPFQEIVPHTIDDLGATRSFGRPSFGHAPRPGKRFYSMYVDSPAVPTPPLYLPPLEFTAAPMPPAAPSQNRSAFAGPYPFGKPQHTYSQRGAPIRSARNSSNVPLDRTQPWPKW